MKTLQEQIDEFYKETGYQLEVKDGRPYYEGHLYLTCRDITKLPDNLVVGKCLYLRYSSVTKLPNNLVVGGSLCIEYTNIDELPENLVVGGNLFLKHTKITELPDNLVVGGNLDLFNTEIIDLSDNLVVGGYLNISYTKITKLPDNLVVGTCLYLRNTNVIKLPDNLVVGGCLNISHTKITELPDNLVVGGRIFGVSGTPITPTLTQEAKKKIQKIKGFLQSNVGGKTYIKVDDIFSVVDNHKGNMWITHQIGTNETLYVVTDGEGHYAHGNTLKETKTDLIYKINDRDTSSYENLSLDDEVSFEEAIAMYRTITGACAAGTRNYIENRLPTPHKKRYTIREIIDLTDGEYGSETFNNFFDKKK